MANFQKHGQNVNGKVLTAAAGKPYELGLWGPIDTRSMTELSVTITPASAGVGVKRGGMLPGQNVRVWHFTGLPAGRTLVEAKDTGGLVWTSVTIDTTGVGTPSGPGKKYTDDPNEVPTRTTTPAAREVVNMLRASWGELTPDGAHTLTSQFMHETGAGKHCYNWNLGNVKSGTGNPHMYLHGVWEVDTPAAAQAQVDKSGGLAHIATADEIKKHGWGLPAGKAIAVFDPPHPQSRFRAYGSLQDGSQRWLAHHQAIAARNPAFLTALNAGDTTAVAHALKQAKYYSGSEPDYARGMARYKAEIDRALGPVP